MESTTALLIKILRNYWPVLVGSVILGLIFAGPSFALALVVLVLLIIRRKSIQWQDSWVFKLFTVGLAVRLTLIILKFAAHRFLGTHLSIFGDSDMNITSAQAVGLVLFSDWRIGKGLAVPLKIGEYGYSITHWIYGIIYIVVGQSPFMLHVFNTLFNCLAGVLVYLIAIRLCKHKPSARLAMGMVLFFPSQIMWSVEMLKEPLIQFYSALVIFLFVEITVNKKWKYLFLISFLWYPLGHIRKFTHLLMLATLGLASVFAFPRRFKTSVIISLVLLAAFAVKLGPSGISTRWEAAQNRIIGSQHGFITTGGSWYMFLPDRLAPPVKTPYMTPVEFSKSFVRAVGYYLLVPIPFKDISFNKLPALPQMVVWYFLLFLCFIPGSLYLLRYQFRNSAIIFAYMMLFTAAQALFTGNEGTAFRQRDTLTVIYFIPMAIGFFNLRGWLATKMKSWKRPAEVSAVGGEIPDGIS